MDPKLCKKTQDTLGKLIKKPPLTEKLLSKPPFRFLHDVMTSVIKTTGFMQGLFTDSEMNSENVKDKDSKIAFLQKSVDMVALVVGKSLSVKPVKVVAGYEPEKTNEFLQALADAVNKNVDNDEYVKRVLGRGGSKSSEKEGRREKEKERSKSADRRKSRDGEDRKEKEGDREKSDRERRHDREKDKHKDKDRESKPREKSRDSREERHRDRSRKDIGNRPPPQKKALTSGASSSGRSRKLDQPVGLNRRSGNSNILPSKMKEVTTTNSSARPEKAPHGAGSKASVRPARVEGPKHPPHVTPYVSHQCEDNACGDTEVSKQPCGMAAAASVAGAGHGMFVNPQGDGLGASNPLEEVALNNRDQSREKENESPGRINGEKEGKQLQEAPARLQRPSSAKGSRRRREGLRNGELDDDVGGDEDEEEEMPKDRQINAEDEEFQKEMAPSKDPVIGEDDLPPQIAAARQLARPSSARPAPPRPKQEASESEPSMRLGGGQPTNLIVDDGNEDDDEDDNFLVEESAPPPPSEPEPISTKPTDEEDAEHGALVKKMLESKKDLEGGSQNQAAQNKKTEIERPIMSDAQRRKQREIVQKEIDKLRASIQSLTRSANPLGKVMDYVQEDLDSMQQELDKWKQENAQHAMDLKKEMSVTDRAVEPLKQQLTNLERAISDQLDQIAATKCNIIKNDQKIEKVLRGITSS